MNKYLLYLILFITAVQISLAQENGVVALDLPIRNSLKFNKYAVNPTFSFVREQNKYISFSNKRQWVQFNDAPQTYLFSYSGRFGENIGAGIGLFQQDYGLQTTFGGILNFAYNVVLNRENNLTFGLNIGAYQSGINEGNVITNFPDPALQNIPNHFLLTVNPGINYGTEFFDFGLSVNNLVSYNLNASKLLEDNPEQGLQAHVMYTGYMNTRGFFDESKFSTLIRSEFQKETTVISGLAMLTIPKGIWGQVGYNTLFGASAGIGLNISEQIALEYNYEQSVGELSNFGNSHEFTVAYRFRNNNRYVYSGDDDEKSLFTPKRKKRTIAKRKSNTSNQNRPDPRKTKPKTKPEEDRNQSANKELNKVAENDNTEEKVELEAVDNIKEIEQVNSEEEAQKADEAAKLEAERIAKEETERIAAEKLKAEEAARERAAEAQRQKELAEARSREEALKRKQEAERQAKLEAERVAAEKQKAEEAAKAREEALKRQQEEEGKALEGARLKAEAEEEARLEAEQLKAAQEEKARLETERLNAEAAEKARLEAEAKAREEAEQLKAAQEEKARQETERLKAEVEEKARLEAEAEKVNNEPKLDPETSNSIKELSQSAVVSKEVQNSLIERLTEKVAIKQKDLDDLKKENDLSEQGIFVAPKPFKSVTAENAEIQSLKDEIDKEIEEQRIKIEELEAVLVIRRRKVRDDNDPLNAAYLKSIEELKAQLLKTMRIKADLEASLENIMVATEVERKRRIKRAVYDNQQDRYAKDSASLAFIKKFTDVGTRDLTINDFDFGEKQNGNIQIVKNVSHAESGYYMVLAVHDDETKRDEFLSQVVSTGNKDINFFFDVNTNKYFIYGKKFDTILQAQREYLEKGDEPYNAKMSIVKIEN